MINCSKELLQKIQEEIDKFSLKTKIPWMSKDRLYSDPDKGGLGTINLETYATSLRCSWYTRGLIFSPQKSTIQKIFAVSKPAKFMTSL